MGNNRVLRLSEHLRKYLLLYIVIAMIVALPIGYHFAPFIKTHKSDMKDIILTLAILTLFPSMVQLKVERFGSEIRGKVLETVVGLIVIFVVAPVIAIFLAGYIANKAVSIGFVAANSVPASSASIAYVLLAEGNIEFATILAIISILGALGTVPAYVSLYAKSISVNVPVKILAESLGIALLTPFFVGQLTRYYLVKRRARSVLRNPDIDLPCKRVEKPHRSLEEAISHIEDALECIEGRIGKRIKPYLSIWTMVAMLILIGSLIASKASLLISKPAIAGQIIGMQLGVYAVIIVTLIAVTKALSMSYEDHSALAFIALTKNESVAAAVSVMAIGAAAAIPAALIPAIQPVIAVLYLWLLPALKRILKMKSAAAEKTQIKVNVKAKAMEPATT